MATLAGDGLSDMAAQTAVDREHRHPSAVESEAEMIPGILVRSLPWRHAGVTLLAGISLLGYTRWHSLA